MTQIETHLGLTAGDATARVLARAQAYVEHETPSRDADAIAALATVIARDLETAGATVDIRPVPGYGANIVARVPGRTPGPAVLVMAHMDTVHPAGTLLARPFRIEDGRAYGPGIYDMKTGIAVAVESLMWLRDRQMQPLHDVELLITCDEEIGSHSAHDLIVERARAASVVLVPEPCMPDGGVKTFRKGVATYRVKARGRAAHAGIDGAAAVSATAELIRALAAALDLADHPRGTTINVGTISGGTASNVVAAEAEALVDVRLAEPAEGERVHAALTSLTARHPEAGLEVTLSESRPPLVRTDAVAGLYERARDLAKGLGVDLMEGGTGGGSDGSIAAAAGAATLDGLGAQGGGAHADNEHIVLADLPFRLALFTRLLESL